MQIIRSDNWTVSENSVYCFKEYYTRNCQFGGKAECKHCSKDWIL